jgi:hypothetical protein
VSKDGKRLVGLMLSISGLTIYLPYPIHHSHVIELSLH